MIERKTSYSILDLYTFDMGQFRVSTPSFQNSFSEGIDPTVLASGDIVSNFQQRAGVLYQGKTAFDNTQTGYRLGIENSLAKFYIGNTTSYINWDGATLTITGGLSVSSIDIGGSDTTSMHVDSSGNMWLGNATFVGAPFKVASTGEITAISGTIGGWTLSSTSLSTTSGGNTVTLSTGATAFISGPTGTPTIEMSQAGEATFKAVRIGGTTIQYTITDTGIFSYGDGSDGAASLDGTNTYSFMSKSGSDYTLTRDVYLTDLTISAGVTLTTAGYRIFCKDTLTNSGTIKWNGNAGQAGSAGAEGAGGAALADGYLKGSVAGGQGGNSSADPGDAGTAVINSIGNNGAAGGAGQAGGAGGAGGTATASNVKLIANWHLATLLDVSSSGSTVKFTSSAGSGGGGASIMSGGQFGGGGGGGSGGGIIAIYARIILNNVAGIIQSNGGAGGDGGNSGTGFTGGGGAGGNGGEIILVYNAYTNNGTVQTAGGAGGSGNASGSAGNAGNVRAFQLSL